MKCKDCKYSSSDESDRTGMLSCDNSILESTYDKPSEESKVGGIVTENDEGWGFYVGPSFGCIHFDKA